MWFFRIKYHALIDSKKMVTYNENHCFERWWFSPTLYQIFLRPDLDTSRYLNFILLLKDKCWHSVVHGLATLNITLCFQGPNLRPGIYRQFFDVEYAFI